MNTAEILAEAADHIDEVGLHKGDFYDPRGTGVCAMTAVFAAVGIAPIHVCLVREDSREVAAARAAIERFDDWRGGILPLTEWSDAPERTAEQVTSALRDCAAEVAERDGIRRPEQLVIAGAS